MVGMPGHTTEPEHDGAVLERSVAIPKTRTDCPHLRARRVAHHLSQPASFVHFNVVVEKSEDLTAGVVRRPVVQAAEVKQTRLVQNTGRTFGFELAKVIERLFVDGIVVHNQDIERGIIGHVAQAFDTTAQQTRSGLASG